MKYTDEQENYIFEEFTRYFPHVADAVTKWCVSGQFEVTMFTDDEQKCIYNSIDHSLFMVGPIDKDNITEDECRARIGRRIETILFDIGMTQDELANEIGVNQGTVSRYINGTTSVSMSMLCKIAKATGRQVTDFMDLIYF